MRKDCFFFGEIDFIHTTVCCSPCYQYFICILSKKYGAMILGATASSIPGHVRIWNEHSAKLRGKLTNLSTFCAHQVQQLLSEIEERFSPQGSYKYMMCYSYDVQIDYLIFLYAYYIRIRSHNEDVCLGNCLMHFYPVISLNKSKMKMSVELKMSQTFPKVNICRM